MDVTRNGQPTSISSQRTNFKRFYSSDKKRIRSMLKDRNHLSLIRTTFLDNSFKLHVINFFFLYNLI